MARRALTARQKRKGEEVFRRQMNREVTKMPGNKDTIFAPRYPWHSTEDDYRQKETLMNLPDIETVSAKVHEAWMESKRAQGVTTRLSEKGEELMVPYEQLSNEAQELDRGTVRAVYAAIKAAGQ